MADPHATGEHPDYSKIYYAVGAALGVATLLSFGANFLQSKDVISHTTSTSLIVLVSVIKACLVGYIFMHLKWDWSRLYFLIIPAFIMGMMMIVVLLPDLVFAWMVPDPLEYRP